MKHQDYYFALLLCASALAGCSTDVEEEFPAEAQPGQEWKAVAFATGDSIVVEDDVEGSTRALFYGGNNLRYYTLWDEGDQVTVYKNGSEVGTLTPSVFGTLSTSLTGTLTGPFEVGDKLIAWRPSANLNYSGQTGGINDLSRYFSFAKAEIEVEQAADNILSLSDVNPTQQQSYLLFVLTDDAAVESNRARLHVEELQIFAANGGIIKTHTPGEDPVYFTDADPLTISTVKANGEYPSELFVALNKDNGTQDTYRLKAVVGGDIYVGPATNSNAISNIPGKGVLGRIIRTMTKTSPASGLTIEDIQDYTFTGYAITPVAGDVIVKDGEDVLTLNTDYSYAGSNNVNVGEATLTVTGLAMSGPRAETKYLGTKTKTFNIVKATPVIEVSTDKMSLVNHEGGTTSQTRAVTRVFIDNNANGTWDEGVDFDITDAVTISYESANTGVCTVTNAGLVTAVGPGVDVTITITVPEAANWTEKTATFLVDVQGEVRNGNQIAPWGDGGTTTDDTHTGY